MTLFPLQLTDRDWASLYQITSFIVVNGDLTLSVTSQEDMEATSFFKYMGPQMMSLLSDPDALMTWMRTRNVDQLETFLSDLLDGVLEDIRQPYPRISAEEIEIDRQYRGHVAQLYLIRKRLISRRR